MNYYIIFLQKNANRRNISSVCVFYKHFDAPWAQVAYLCGYVYRPIDTRCRPVQVPFTHGLPGGKGVLLYNKNPACARAFSAGFAPPTKDIAAPAAHGKTMPIGAMKHTSRRPCAGLCRLVKKALRPFYNKLFASMTRHGRKGYPVETTANRCFQRLARMSLGETKYLYSTKTRP